MLLLIVFALYNAICSSIQIKQEQTTKRSTVTTQFHRSVSVILGEAQTL